MATRIWITGQYFRLAIPALWAFFAQAQPVHDGEKFHKKETTLVIIGKTGNGKSSLGNTITGQQSFAVGRSLSSTTREVQVVKAKWGNSVVKVVDTPDPVNSNLTPEQLKTEIEKWKRLASPGPSAILLAVRCDVRYTAEEYDIYKKIKAAWADDSFKRVLVIAFTFGDRQDTDLDKELKTVCPELKNVLKDSGGRYALFNPLGSKEEIKEQVQKLQNIIDGIGRTSLTTGSSEEAANSPGKISSQEVPGSPDFLKSAPLKNVMAISCVLVAILAAVIFKKRF